MKYPFILAYLLSVILLSIGHKPIDFPSGSLKREIKKINNTSNFSIEEDTVFNWKHKNIINGKVFIVNHQDENHPIAKYVYVGRVETCRGGGCAAPAPDGFSGNAEYFDYFILFDVQMKVRLVKVFNYQATHGYEVSAKGWLKQFVGFNDEKPLRVGHDIDAISGATISVFRLVGDVERVSKSLSVWFAADLDTGR